MSTSVHEKVSRCATKDVCGSIDSWEDRSSHRLYIYKYYT